MSRFLNQQYRSLEAYTPGEQPRDTQYIKLNTNESPFPPSPKVIDAITREEIKNLKTNMAQDIIEIEKQRDDLAKSRTAWLYRDGSFYFG